MPRWLFIAVVLTASQAAGGEIPLSEFVATVHQDGLQHIGSGRRSVDGKRVVEDYASAMQNLMQSRDGASNAVLVDAANIGDAVKATARIFSAWRPADKPAVPLNVESQNYWLAVYLGAGHSSPTTWIVDSAKVDGNTIRFIYRKPQRGYASGDVVRYYYWVPLGRLDEGVYYLELYETNLKARTLSRRVEILPPRQGNGAE